MPNGEEKWINLTEHTRIFDFSNAEKWIMCKAFFNTDVNKMIQVNGFPFMLRSNIPELDWGQYNVVLSLVLV